METLACTKCLQEKPVTEFNPVPSRKRGYASWCRACYAQYARENPSPRSAEAKAANNARTLRYYHMKRAQAMAVLGGVCASCGEADYCVLQIDHVHGGGLAERRKIGNNGLHLKIIAGAPGYQVLCANCHHRKTFHAEDEDVA